MRRVLFLVVIVCLATLTAKAQDPVKVAPQHYKVEFENAQVRVLRIHYGPHEKGPMHEHPAGVLVALTDENTRFTLPDGKTAEVHMKAGETRWAEATKHAGENLSDKPEELIFVELKGKPAKPPAAKKKG